VEPDYPNHFDPAKDDIFVKNYLKLLQMGRASARPVIEKETKVHENYWCFLKFPKITRKSGNWLTMAGVEVFSAYFDDRENSLYTQNSAVQILVMSNHSIEKANVLIFCNIFSTSTREYATVKGYIREIWQTGWDPRDSFQVPSLITCPIPTRMPKSSQNLVVSLTRRRCHNVPEAMQVVGKPEQGKGAKKDVAVCVKGLDYQISITLPRGNTNDPIARTKYLKSNRPAKRRHELLPYNDCFYQHIHTHRYVLIIDIDEAVVPVRHDNYSRLLADFEQNKAIKNWKISSIAARNVFKFPSNFTLFPRRHHMTSNRKRSKKTSPNGEYGKSFSSTSSVATVFNHFALHKLSQNVAKSQYFSENDALKLHYKSECPWESRNECHILEYDVLDDTSLDKFTEKLSERVDDVAKELRSGGESMYDNSSEYCWF
uniref:Glycosyltransferase family 92 protein n=1 Tax=Caenorhabditis japonica TaxID=281687 RepID=A0A8R1HZ90_CAEJA